MKDTCHQLDPWDEPESIHIHERLHNADAYDEQRSVPPLKGEFRIVERDSRLQNHNGIIRCAGEQRHVSEPRCPSLSPGSETSRPRRGKMVRPGILRTCHGQYRSYLSQQGSLGQSSGEDDDKTPDEVVGSAVVESIVHVSIRGCVSVIASNGRRATLLGWGCLRECRTTLLRYCQRLTHRFPPIPKGGQRVGEELGCRK